MYCIYYNKLMNEIMRCQSRRFSFTIFITVLKYRNNLFVHDN